MTTAAMDDFNEALVVWRNTSPDIRAIVMLNLMDRARHYYGIVGTMQEVIDKIPGEPNFSAGVARQEASARGFQAAATIVGHADSLYMQANTALQDALDAGEKSPVVSDYSVAKVLALVDQLAAERVRADDATKRATLAESRLAAQQRVHRTKPEDALDRATIRSIAEDNGLVHSADVLRLLDDLDHAEKQCAAAKADAKAANEFIAAIRGQLRARDGEGTLDAVRRVLRDASAARFRSRSGDEPTTVLASSLDYDGTGAATGGVYDPCIPDDIKAMPTSSLLRHPDHDPVRDRLMQEEIDIRVPARNGPVFGFEMNIEFPGRREWTDVECAAIITAVEQCGLIMGGGSLGAYVTAWDSQNLYYYHRYALEQRLKDLVTEGPLKDVTRIHLGPIGTHSDDD